MYVDHAALLPITFFSSTWLVLRTEALARTFLGYVAIFRLEHLSVLPDWC